MRALLAWLALLAFSPLGHCDPAQVLEDCAASASAHTPENKQNVLQQCPDLERAVTDLGLAEQLGPDWQHRLNPTALAQLAQQVRRYQSQPLSSAPHVESLRQVMRMLQPAEHPSRWPQVKQWLASRLREPQQDMGWMQQPALAHPTLPPRLALALGYVAVAAVLALAVWIVWRELRALGVADDARTRRDRGRQGARVTRRGTKLEPELPDLESIPDWQRPAALLAALVQALRRSGRLNAMERGQAGRIVSWVSAASSMTAHSARASWMYRCWPSAACTAHSGEPHRRCRCSRTRTATQVLADGIALYRQLRA